MTSTSCPCLDVVGAPIGSEGYVTIEPYEGREWRCRTLLRRLDGHNAAGQIERAPPHEVRSDVRRRLRLGNMMEKS